MKPHDKARLSARPDIPFAYTAIAALAPAILLAAIIAVTSSVAAF